MEKTEFPSKNFLIIFHKISIFLCFICTDAMVTTTAEITVLEINYYIAESIVGGNMLKVNS